MLAAYCAHKLERNEEVEAAREAGVTLRDGRGQPRRPLSPRTINMTLDLTARILTDAVKRGLLPSNPAADRELRLKTAYRKGNFLEADELLALIEAASGIDAPISKETLARGELTRQMRRDNRTWKQIAAEFDVAESTAIWLARRHGKDGHASPRRAILATLGCGGLRHSEVCQLNLADLDFAHGVIHVRDAKTEAGVRQVNMTPWLHDELLAYRATRANAELDEPAFPTRRGARAGHFVPLGYGSLHETPGARRLLRLHSPHGLQHRYKLPFSPSRLSNPTTGSVSPHLDREGFPKALCRTRTDDPFLTIEALARRKVAITRAFEWGDVGGNVLN